MVPVKLSLFALRGVTYEIDLTNTHIEELEAFLQPYVDAGRRQRWSRSAAIRKFKQ